MSEPTVTLTVDEARKIRSYLAQAANYLHADGWQRNGDEARHYANLIRTLIDQAEAT